jgi:uncharacterized protein (DUF1778 family)
MGTKAQIHAQAPSAAKSLLKRAAVKRTQDDLVNQYTFSLNKTQWQQFKKRLDAKPRAMPRLQALLYQPASDFAR